MKVIRDSQNQVISLESENKDEEAAIEYLRNHTPLFAGMEIAIIKAFLAGIDYSKPKA